MKKSNRRWVYWGIALLVTGLVVFGDNETESYSVPIPIYQPDTIRTIPKKYDVEDWKGWDDDSLRELYDPNHPDYDYDPNDPNRGEWQGYYD